MRTLVRCTAIALALCAVIVEAQVPAVERDASMVLYDATDGDHWDDNTNWLGAAGTECTWYGVACSGGSVQRLDLNYNSLDGTVPAELQDLSALEALDLDGNDLTGTIPPELRTLNALQFLVLGRNSLTGSIPAQLGDLSALRYLVLNYNSLDGGIPLELGGLSNLERLYLDNNQLTGGIPPELGQVSGLWELRLQGNQLTGPIPAELCGVSSLRYLYLDENQLVGSIPACFGDLASLRDLHVDHNRLAGTVPAELGDLSQLLSLRLGHNHLDGDIPAQLGILANLSRLYLESNRLTGSVPAQLGDLTELQYLYLGGNRLAGGIPVELADLSSLSDLDISYNALWTDDLNLDAFLDAMDPGWWQTQTLAPESVSAGSGTSCTVTVTWDPVGYTAEGGYRVWCSESSGGPYERYPVTVESKADNELLVTGLDPVTTYSFVVESFTLPHVSNQSTVVSEVGAEASATTAAGSPHANRDVNGDGAEDMDDLDALTAYFFGGAVSVADVDCDGEVNAGDVVALIDFLAP